MLDATGKSRDMLKKYAYTLIANAQAVSEEERDEIADDLIEITGIMEEHGKQVAQLIHELLEQSAGAPTQ